MAREVVIVSTARTPLGAFQGSLSSLPAPRLGEVAIKAAVSRAGLAPADIQEAFIGQVLQGAVGQAPARQAVLGAGLPVSVPCTTVNKVCGSGLQAAVLAARAIALGEIDIAVAGGMESMTNAPYFLPAARAGHRMGHGKVIDMMIHDGLWDPYNDFHMGNAAELCAKEKNVSREEQDEFAQLSTNRSIESQKTGLFKEEIVPVEVPQRRGDPVVVDQDEGPMKARPDKIPTLRPAFQKDGTVTAGNASSINDGAAAVVLMSAEEASRRGLEPMAKIRGWGVGAREPQWFTMAPADSIRNAMKHAGTELSSIERWEINEAFAVVALANMRELGLSTDIVNVRGGAVALGHPIGASGARVLVTLLHILKDEGKSLGCTSLCLGGGEAISMVVER